MKSNSVEAIYPLTFLQQRLLLHSLSNKTDDQGFIQVTCKLDGPLRLDLMKASWQSLIALHEAFRTSIHWEDLEKPVQVVHKEAGLDWQYLDYSKDLAKQQEQINEFLIQDKKLGINFLKPPISRCTLIKLNENEHLMVWSCHHLLIDGWSGKIVIEHISNYYHHLCNNNTFQAPLVPRYEAFLDWVAKQDLTKAKRFWSEYLGGLTETTLMSALHQEGVTTHNFSQKKLLIPAESFTALTDLLKRHRVTLSSFLNSTWGLLLGILSDSQDVVIGSTVAGRSTGFPHIENMVGLFMNVLPVRVKIDTKQTYGQFLTENQNRRLLASEFEYIDQDTINSWINWKSNKPLFDSLVLTQNFMAGEIKGDHLTLSEIKGRVTSTQVLTIVAEPVEHLEITLKYDAEIVDASTIEWISNSLLNTITKFTKQEQLTVAALQSNLDHPPLATEVNDQTNLLAGEQSKPDYVPATTSMELKLAKIWEEVIGHYPIGIDDNFFEIGGDSFMALQLIGRVSHELDKEMSPTTLIQYPTIRSMVNSWEDETSHEKLPSLVPIRAKGNKPPLFVIHGGGGHVFFYYPLAKHLDEDQPVYALEPVGLFGESEMHKSTKAMADHYLATIKRLVPTGPFSILGTCLSDPICIEINNSMREMGESPLAMIIVDSSPLHLIPRKRAKANLQTRINRFRDRFHQNASKAVKKIFVGRYNKAFQPLKHKFKDLSVQYGSDEQAKNLRTIQMNLRTLYSNYKWDKFDGRVTLIKAELNRSWDEEVWQSLAKRGVKVITIPGPHISRFDEPQVNFMAESLQKELDELHSKLLEEKRDKSRIYQKTR